MRKHHKLTIPYLNKKIKRLKHKRAKANLALLHTTEVGRVAKLERRIAYHTARIKKLKSKRQRLHAQLGLL